jgi:hypothetical protein
MARAEIHMARIDMQISTTEITYPIGSAMPIDVTRR